jgi:hypothetical protein
MAAPSVDPSGEKWRFKPNSLTEVQLPVFFTETYRRVW